MSDPTSRARDDARRVSPRVLLLGTGKMARNLGRFLAGHDVRLSFASQSAERLGELEAWSRKRMRRVFQAADPEAVPAFVPLAAPLTEAARSMLSQVDIVIEATREEAAAKAALFALLAPLVSRDALLTSCSSSILPSEIHPRSLGLHFFYPVELTGFVELVRPAVPSPSREAEAATWCTALGLRVVAQAEPEAFVANRLLLPLQAECARALAAGQDPALLDAATISDLLPVGQLALMDAVGLDVLAASVGYYLGRMAPARAEALRPLESLLRVLVDEGRLGDKTGNGLVQGGPLPRATRARLEPSGDGDDRAPVEPALFRALFVNSCLAALASGQIDRPGLDVVLDGIYGGAAHFGSALEREAESMQRLLEALFARTGRWYCSPAPGFGAPRP